MRVLVIIGLYPPDHAGGGLRIHRTYTAMRDKFGVDFQVLAEPIRISGMQDYPEVTRVRTEMPDFLLAIKLAWALLLAKRNIDIVHCIGPTRMTVVSAALCRLLRIPYVTELSVDYDLKGKSGNLINRFLLRAYFKPAGGIALSPRIAQLFHDFGLSDERLYIRPNPVMLEMAPQAMGEENLLEKIGAMKCSFRHLLLGRLCTRKNQLFALHILRNMTPEHGLVLAGPVIGEEDYFDAVKGAIVRYGLQDRVVLWPQTVAAPAKIFPLCSSVWCPSILEGLPNVVLEGLWYGLPAFVNQGLGLGGWVIDPENGAEFPLDSGPESCASIILDALKTGFDSQVIQLKARSDFNPEIIIRDTHAFLCKIAKQNY